MESKKPILLLSSDLYSYGAGLTSNKERLKDASILNIQDFEKRDHESQQEMLESHGTLYIITSANEGPLPRVLDICDNEIYHIKAEECQDADKSAYPYILNAKLMELMLEQKESKNRKLSEQISSYLIAIDSIYSLSSYDRKEDIINHTKEFFAMMCLPENLCYFEAHNTKARSGIHLTDFQKKEIVAFLKSNEYYKIAPSKKSFCFRLTLQDGDEGIFVLENIAYKSRLHEFLNLTLSIRSVLTLILENIARQNELVKSHNLLADANDMLKVINKILRHDLANNLGAIKMSLEMNETRPNPKYIQISKKAVDRSFEKINDMKGLENLISTGKDLDCYEVKEIIENITGTDIEMDISIDGQCKVLADNALSSVFENIIKNAIAHGKANKMRIKMAPSGKYCHISIEDNGTGIPDEIKTKIFKEGFTEGRDSNSGLGLYISKKVIERYGGHIAVKDNTPHGAKFILDIPSTK
ncbi:sensor histidine kinase [Methanohalophilus sp.]